MVSRKAWCHTDHWIIFIQEHCWVISNCMNYAYIATRELLIWVRRFKMQSFPWMHLKIDWTEYIFFWGLCIVLKWYQKNILKWIITKTTIMSCFKDCYINVLCKQSCYVDFIFEHCLSVALDTVSLYFLATIFMNN